MKRLIPILFASAALTGVFPLPASAGTTAPPLLTISVSGAKDRHVAVFDKWTDGATVAVGDLGTDGVPEIVVGAGPGSLPEIRILRKDGSLIKKFNAFTADLKSGVIVSVADIDADGTNEILAALGPKLGRSIRVFDGTGTLLHDWYPIPASFTSFTSSISAATVPAAVGVSVPAPHFLSGRPEVEKEITVDLSEQRLYAYERGELATTFLVSTGSKKFPTPPGSYHVLRKIAKMDYRWSYGPDNPDNYSLPNVHWNSQFLPHMYIHEAYWHNAFGTVRSHGCVNARLGDAKFIYDWAPEGTPVTVAL
jgi:hypothetical protein